MDITVFLVEGKRKYPDVRVCFPDEANCIDVAGFRHGEVRQHHVRVQGGYLLYPRFRILRSAHDAYAGFGGKQRLQSLSQQRVIVDNQDLCVCVAQIQSQADVAATIPMR